jgi:hypothetical protein
MVSSQYENTNNHKINLKRRATSGKEHGRKNVNDTCVIQEEHDDGEHIAKKHHKPTQKDVTS